jgi:hypothetical protein
MAHYKDAPDKETGEIGNAKSDEEEWKKFHAMQEMSYLQQLTTKTYCQCLMLTIIVAVGLTYLVFMSPFKMNAPDASNFLNWSAFAFFAVLAFVMVTCNDSSSMRFMIIITMAVFYGFSIGFLIALNFTVEAKKQNALRGSHERPAYGQY